MTSSPRSADPCSTMMFLTSGRIDLATSFSLFTPEITHDFSRIYPHYREPKTARPLDAFTGVTDPQVYDLELTPDWHQIALYNTSEEKAVVSTAISGAARRQRHRPRPDRALSRLRILVRHLPRQTPRHRPHRARAGTQPLRDDLGAQSAGSSPGAQHQPPPPPGLGGAEGCPLGSRSKTLSGTASVIGGEPFQIVVANNGAKALESDANGGKSELKPHPVAGLSCLTLSASANTDVTWILKCE